MGLFLQELCQTVSDRVPIKLLKSVKKDTYKEVGFFSPLVPFINLR